MQRAGIQRLSIRCMRLLFHDAGSSRSRTVLREGRRVRGSFLDAEVNGAFQLRFSVATRDAWFGLARALPALSTGDSGSRNIKRVARESIITTATLPGDWLFLFLIAQGLMADSLFADTTLPIRRRLWEASPLAGLAELRATTSSAVEALLTPPSVRLVELLDDILVRSWDAEIATALMHRGSRGPFIARFSEIASTLSTWIGVLEAHQRLDLVRSVAQFFVVVTTRLDPPDGDSRTHFTRHLEIASIRERDEALAPLRRLLDVGIGLLQRRDELAQCGYGEARHEEAQLFVRAVDDELGPVQDRLRACASAMSGTVGSFESAR